MPSVSRFDRVRIATTPETERLGYARRPGKCHGFTTPSVTGIEVVGSIAEDYALNVSFDDAEGGDAWFSAALVEFIDHAPGTVVTVGEKSSVRRADGSWEEMP